MGVGEGKGALGCSANFARLILVIFNVIFFIGGLGILGLSIWLYFDPSVFNYFRITAIDQASLGIVVYVGVAIGALIFILGFLGCCGAWKKSTCMLCLYSVLLTLIILVEVAAIVIAVLFQGVLEGMLLDTMENQVKDEYKSDEKDLMSKAWNFVQWEVKCCGANNYTDYKGSKFVKEMNDTVAVPRFCCKTKDGSTFETPLFRNKTLCQIEAERPGLNSSTAMYLNPDGCYEGLLAQLNKYSNMIMLVVALVIVIEVLLMIFSCCLCCAVKNEGKVKPMQVQPI